MLRVGARDHGGAQEKEERGSNYGLGWRRGVMKSEFFKQMQLPLVTVYTNVKLIN
jgi:hypothetical protein